MADTKPLAADLLRAAEILERDSEVYQCMVLRHGKLAKIRTKSGIEMRRLARRLRRAAKKQEQT